MYLTSAQLEDLLAKKDLTEQSDHCVSIIVERIRQKLEKKYSIAPSIEKGTKVVSAHDNYYALGYDKNEVTLGTRYTKYLNETDMLRTQMSSVIPPLLRNYQKNGDKLWMCPGIVYRRDVRDKTHVGEPHQMDVWYLTSQSQTRQDLIELVETIISVIEDVHKKKIQWRYNETSHNYTDDGIEVEIYYQNRWLEILECGLISKKLLANHGLSEYSGLALGMGLERLAMIIKNIDDIRILNSNNPLIQKQLTNLNKYKAISNQPSMKRDLSIAVDKDLLEEELTELILDSISEGTQSTIESIQILAQTNYEDLPTVAQERLGMVSTQKNILLRIVLRDIERTLTSDEANDVYRQIYQQVHKGTNGYLI
jgi:phenylalanyl-tRNA synthetase alpha chain